MPATVTRGDMGYVYVTTTDRYGTERHYEFRPNRNGLGVCPTDDYTPVVLTALWDEGIPVEWNPDDLSASQRAQLDGFCDDCGTALRHDQVDVDMWADYCPECSSREEAAPAEARYV